MDTTTTLPRTQAPKLVGFTVPWWLYLITATAWVIIAWAVLRFDLTSVASVAVLAGVVVLVAAVAEIFNAFTAPGWRWLHAGLGVLFLLTGFFCLFNPGSTFAWLAAFIGWYLLFKGMLDIVLAFVTKNENEAWWLGLIVGIIEVILGFWAAGRFGRSVALLIVFVGAIALTRAITDVILAFRLRAAQHALAATPTASTAADLTAPANLTGRPSPVGRPTEGPTPTERPSPAGRPSNTGPGGVAAAGAQ